MRTAATLLNTLPPPSTPTTKASMSPPEIVQRSPWNSPVPYLFGGLAAMLGLIAFALLILACSYWRLTGSQVDNRENGDAERDLENGGVEKTGDDGNNGKEKIVYEEKIVVIMAGDVNPTFLATPMANYKASSFGHCNGKNEKKGEEGKTEEREKEKQLEQSTTTTIIMEEDNQERETQAAEVIHEQTQ